MNNEGHIKYIDEFKKKITFQLLSDIFCLLFFVAITFIPIFRVGLHSKNSVSIFEIINYSRIVLNDEFFVKIHGEVMSYLIGSIILVIIFFCSLLELFRGISNCSFGLSKKIDSYSRGYYESTKLREVPESSSEYKHLMRMKGYESTNTLLFSMVMLCLPYYIFVISNHIRIIENEVASVSLITNIKGFSFYIIFPILIFVAYFVFVFFNISITENIELAIIKEDYFVDDIKEAILLETEIIENTKE